MGSTQSTWGHRERGMSAPNSPGGGARNRKKFQTAAQLDEAFDNFKAGQKDEDTEKSGKQKMKGFMKDVSTYGPMVMLCLFAATVLLLTISQSLACTTIAPRKRITTMCWGSSEWRSKVRSRYLTTSRWRPSPVKTSGTTSRRLSPLSATHVPVVRTIAPHRPPAMTSITRESPTCPVRT